MKKIRFMDTSFRDGFQSCYGARVLTEDFLPALEASVEAGITHFEAGGGARFQSLFFYCGESAFDMMDAFRKVTGPEANLQTLARGISVVALSAQPRDIIDLHAKMFKKHGMTTIRNFDALNDVRNLKYSGECIVKAGLQHEVTVSLMDLPPGCSGAHDTDFYMKILRKILDEGVRFSSICFKDASGTANPEKVYETIRQARNLVGSEVDLIFHTHDTISAGISQCLAAISGGADQIDLSKSPVSGGTCQPDILSMWHALKDTEYTLDIDINKILKAMAKFEECMKNYFMPPEAKQVTPRVALSPMPGGALTANTMMMRDTNTLHLYPDVINAMSECVVKGGFGTSVTPVSQFYFQQAYANVSQGPWKKITDGYGKMVLGYFGRTPVKPDPKVVKIASKQLGLPVIDGDPVEDLEPGIPKAKKILEVNGLEVTDENIFIVASCESKGVDFLKGKSPVNVRKLSSEEPRKVGAEKTDARTAAPPISGAKRNYHVQVNGETFQVSVQSEGGEIKAVTGAQPPPPDAAAAKTAPAAAANGHQIKAELPGHVLSIEVEVGEKVKKGDTLLVLDAMKMETPVHATVNGTVKSIAVKKGETVEAGALLMVI
jgi:pyruvate carboxylase subunit B